jgi:hypothetical protein
MMLDPDSLRDAFRISNMCASQRARWCSGDPGADPSLCRYCGRRWLKYAGSKLDGHAACVVTEDFKQQIGDLLRSSPEITFKKVADAIGVTASVVRAWTYPIRTT